MTPLARLLAASIERTAPARAREITLQLRWTTIAGAEIAQRADARVDGSTVILEVDDERWSRELRTMTGLLRLRLDRELGGVKVVEIRHVRVRKSRSKPAATTRDFTPELAPVELTAHQEERLAQIADEDLRNQLRATMTRFIARNRARDERSLVQKTPRRGR